MKATTNLLMRGISKKGGGGDGQPEEGGGGDRPLSEEGIEFENTDGEGGDGPPPRQPYSQNGIPPTDNEHAHNGGNATATIGRETSPPSLNVVPEANAAAVDGTDAEPNVPTGRSEAHDLFQARKTVFLSLDIETGGEWIGIVQLSAEIFRADVVPTGQSTGKDVGLTEEKEW